MAQQQPAMKIFNPLSRVHSACWLVLTMGMLATSATHAQALPVWKLTGIDNDIYLLGSVHFLRQQDYPLAPEIMSVYADADIVMMELDMDDLDPIQAATMMDSKGSLPGDQTLREVMGNDAFTEAQQKSLALGLNLDLFGNKKPWFVGLVVTQLRLMQLGFDPSWGIEQQFLQLAGRDNKPIQGLETMSDQLNALDSMDAETQRLFLQQSLDDAESVEQEMDQIVSAWRSGDANTIETLMLEGLKDMPDLYDSLLVQRNQNWVSKIDNLIDDGNSYLIIVGTMHLVGNDSVITLLEQQGIESEQLAAGSL
jgi:uncharacterized protein YbaP (TraB family)